MFRIFGFFNLTIFFVCLVIANPAFSDHRNGDQCNVNAFDHLAAEKNTAPKLDLFNWLAHGITSATIENGFIISFEKLASAGMRADDLKLYREHLGEYTAQNSGYARTRDHRNLLLAKLRIDPKWPVVTFVGSYQNGKRSNIYNPYVGANDEPHQNSEDVHRSFETGLSELTRTFQAALTSRLKAGGFTHIFFMSMGWNNDQGVALCRYKKLMQETKIAMTARGKSFKPLVVGLTWPSVWLAEKDNVFVRGVGHLGSVFNKANDADEIGVFYGNILINQIIPRANASNLPVTVVGHSYGARLASRAIFSRQLLKNGAMGNGPDLALMLQPAYSAQRHMAGKGLEGYPYATIPGLKTKVFVTSSKGDKANPFAVWSRHFGGIQGLSKARKNGDFFRYIPQYDKIAGTLAALSGANADRPTVINATDFVDDHSDVYNEDVGKVLATILINEAP